MAFRSYKVIVIPLSTLCKENNISIKIFIMVYNDKLTVCSVQLCNDYNAIPWNLMFKYFIIVLPKSKGNTIIHINTWCNLHILLMLEWLRLIYN